MEWGVFFPLKQEAIQNTIEYKLVSSHLELNRNGFQPILQKNETTNIGFSRNDIFGGFG